MTSSEYKPGTSLSYEERQAIIDKCIDALKKDRFANIKFLAERPPKIEIKYLDDAVIIACRISENSEYNWAFSEINEWPYLFVDPSYQLTKSVKSTNNIQKITLLLTIGISLFTAAIAWLTYKKDDVHQINVPPPTQRIDTLRLHTTKPDTFLLYSH